MRLIDMTCPHCGSALKVDVDRQKAFCQYCNQAFDRWWSQTCSLRKRRANWLRVWKRPTSRANGSRQLPTTKKQKQIIFTWLGLPLDIYVSTPSKHSNIQQAKHQQENAYFAHHTTLGVLLDSWLYSIQITNPTQQSLALLFTCEFLFHVEHSIKYQLFPCSNSSLTLSPLKFQDHIIYLP